MADVVYDRLLGKILKKKYIGYRSGIYIIRCVVNNNIYIGSTGNFERRFDCHKLALSHKKHSNYKLQADFDLHGLDNFVFERHLEYMAGFDRSRLYDLEQREINKLSPFYNIQLKVYNPYAKDKKGRTKKNPKERKPHNKSKNKPKKHKSIIPPEVEKKRRISNKMMYLKDLNKVNQRVNNAWRDKLRAKE